MPMEDTCQPVQLEPFIHQVGGHSSMLCLDESTVCKPLIPQELHFYSTLPTDLARFTPKFKGVIEVCFLEDNDGYITLTAYPPECRGAISCDKKHTYTLDKKCPSLFRIRLRRTEDVEIESPFDEMFEELETEHRGVTHNPWVLKCHRDQLKKMDISGSGSFVQKFILLENLTLQFRYPCVLDLKMGVRQYGDDATPAKRQRQEAKVAMSTSGSLGVRICGMQVYQHNLRRFVCRNKYYGRGLTEDGFREALTQFLHNGIRLRTDLLQPMVELLNQLVMVLENQNFRFYTSSLLIIYDGCEKDDSYDDLDEEDDIESGEFRPATPRSTPHSDLQMSPPSVKEVQRVRKVGSITNVPPFPVDRVDSNEKTLLSSPRRYTSNDRKRTPPTGADVDDRIQPSYSRTDADYRTCISPERLDVDDRKHSDPVKQDHCKRTSTSTSDLDDRRVVSSKIDTDDRGRRHCRADTDDRKRTLPSKSDIDDRKQTQTSKSDIDDRKQATPYKSDIDDRNDIPPSKTDIDERKRSSPAASELDANQPASPRSLGGIDEYKPKTLPSGIDDHKLTSHRADGKRDLLSGHVGKRESFSDCCSRRESLSEGSERRDSLSEGTSGKRDSFSSGGRRDSGVTDKHDQSPKVCTPSRSPKISQMHPKLESERKTSSSEHTSSDSSSSGSDHHVNGRASKKITVVPAIVPQCKVDVRMIDFAHSTHSGLDGGNFIGPDRGYIFGLLNLIKVVKSILDENT